jgi:polysaccharide biosynthesis/export protein
MMAIVKSVLFVAVGLLILQLALAAAAQTGRPLTDAVPAVTDPHSLSLSAAGSPRQDGNSAAAAASGAATEPDKAGGTGDPALGGERHPLYRLTRSDTVDVNFTFSPEYNQTLTVQPDGFMFLRDAGPLYAEGLTLSQLHDAVIRAYAGTLHEPQVTTTLKDFEKPFFLASGEVLRPGKYDLRGDLTVSEAVAIAGGLTKQARHSQVVLFRRISPEMAEAHLIDLKKMLDTRNLSEDWHLRPGDFVFVPQSRISKLRRFVPANSMSWYLNPLQF